uniref:N-acetyltransferase domain-containing protein n=1 Tax=Tetraodon nigroviridis TaxID=99883 RepID=H3DQI3_TETNG
MTMPQLPESLSQTGLQFTLATEEDFDDIMAMSQDIYGGLDYLPTRYSSWLKEANRTVILARKQGKVIALESVCVIDNGETMLVEGLRVAPQERGKGVAGVLLRFCSELVKSKFPDVKVTRLTRDDQLGPKDFQKYRIITKQQTLPQSSKFTTYISMLYNWKFGNAPKVIFCPHFAHFCAFQVVNCCKIQLMSNRKQMQTPTLHILLHNALCLVLSNCTLVLSSLCIFSFAVICETGFYPSPLLVKMYYLNIDMFGKDLALVRQQFLAHLQCHTASLKGHVMCQMFLDPPLWKPMAEFCRNTLGVELVKEYTEQCVVESEV